MEDTSDPPTYDWENIPTWSGRYKCRNTGVIGYRGIVLSGHRSRQIDPNEIYPYFCKTCKSPATHKRKGAFYCEKHGKKL